MILVQYHKGGSWHASVTRTLGQMLKGERPSVCDRGDIKPYAIKSGTERDITCKRCLSRLGLHRAVRRTRVNQEPAVAPTA